MLNLVAALVLAHSATAPTEAISPTQKRQAAIWAAVYNRTNTQVDVWWDQGDFPVIIQLIRFQAELYPHDYDIATNLGWMYENVKDNPNAEAAYSRYASRNPNDPDAVLPIVQKAYMSKDYKRVIAVANPAISHKGVHANVFRLLAHSYERTGDLKNALRVWESYLAVNPEDLTAVKHRDEVKQKLAG